ncbi:MAG TPA: DNA repair protein RadC [Stellaceae bacterium]|nr:DNA repair protein RadC [Stellaceae bacterium]
MLPSDNKPQDEEKTDLESKPHYLGHRERLRERILIGGARSLADYELLEFLLFAAKPRGDTKPLAKELLARYGSFAEVLSAEAEILQSVPGMGDASIAALFVVREAATRLLKREVEERPIIESWSKLLDYCNAAFGFSEVEEFHLLFLDNRNMLIADELQQVGTIDRAPLYPREVVKRALALGATSIILVHNHPSGDTQPSQSDINITQAVVKAAITVGVKVHDHVIVGRGNHTSFKNIGLL